MFGVEIWCVEEVGFTVKVEMVIFFCEAIVQSFLDGLRRRKDCEYYDVRSSEWLIRIGVRWSRSGGRLQGGAEDFLRRRQCNRFLTD